MSDLLTLRNPVFSSLVTCSGILGLKMLSVAFLTVQKRFQTKTFANPEDAKQRGARVGQCDDVERVRRIHLNDLENIPPFLILAIMYTLTNPPANMAIMHFRIFTVSRLLHMISYQFALPQPSRSLCFITGLLCTGSIGVRLVMAGKF